MASEQKASPVLTRRRKWLWTIGTLFVAGWMFVLGLMIGRGNAPVPIERFKLDKELDSLKAALFREEQAKVAVDTARDAEQVGTKQLDFFEDLPDGRVQPSKKLRDLPASPQPLELVTQPPAAGQNVAGTGRTEEKPEADRAESSGNGPAVANGTQKTFRQGKVTLRPPSDTAAQPAAASAQTRPVAVAGAPAVGASTPVPAVETSPQTPQTAAVARGGRFTIQIAAVRDAASANRIVGALRAQNFPAYHLSSAVPGQGVWFRVRVGAFTDRESAEAMRSQLSQAQFKGMVVATP